MKKLIGIAFVALGLLAVVTPATAQEQTIRLSGENLTIKSDDDDFSSNHMGSVVFGPFSSANYREIEVTVIAVQDDTGRTDAVLISLARMDVSGEIVSVAARGGVNFPALRPGSSGRVNCGSSRYSRCVSAYARTFEIPSSVLAQLRTGEAVDVRMRTSVGQDGDVVFTLDPGIISALDAWLANRAETN